MGRVDVIDHSADPLPERGQRVPFGGLSQKLAVHNKDPNYFYCWFRDQGDTIQRAEAAWYEFVSPREARGVKLLNRDVHGGNQSVMGDRYEVFGGRDDFGRGYNMVLMRQPRQYYEEDQKLATEQTNQIDFAINRQAQESGKYGSVTMQARHEE